MCHTKDPFDKCWLKRFLSNSRSRSELINRRLAFSDPAKAFEKHYRTKALKAAFSEPLMYVGFVFEKQ
jgi:hypothetical protein